jgi:RNA recognition motif-containing protein
MVSNLSYRASIEEILEAFREFDVKPDQIIRRFNDNGQPTGMACINFNSPEDASRACDQFNKTLVANRPIWLRRA